MKKKGFTLIELLAVIVVLAIIAVIATPMVLNTIDESRQGAAKSSGYGYINGLETSLASYMLRNNGVSYSAGKYDIATLNTDLDVTIKGEKPSEGKVCVSSDGTVTKASLKVNGYIISYDGKEVKNTDLKEIEDITCDGEVALVGDPVLDKAKALVYDDTGVCKTDGSTYNYMGGCYIKGASTNNYVWYNGFMWRIMGINSDNTIRLITDENVTVLTYGKSNTALTYTTNEGYIHDWLNEYFYNHLNSTKNIIKDGSYFCSESTNGVTLTEGRTTCTSGNEITAKVGLISIDEYLLAGTEKSYLNINQYSWTMTPYSVSNVWHVNYSGNALTSDVIYPRGVRPAINISSAATITSGDGGAQSFYVLGENKTTSIAGTLSKKVTSGEYVKLEGKTYRIVSKENAGVKLVLDGYYEETEGNSYTMSYGDSNTFTLDSGIGQKLNGDVLNWLGLSSSDKIVTTTYYQSDGLDAGASYFENLKQNNGAEAKVGLLQVGDILAGQSSTILTKNYTITSSSDNAKSCWAMNKFISSSYAWSINRTGNSSYNAITDDVYALRPVIVVRNDLNITGGTGVWNNPYQI